MLLENQAFESSNAFILMIRCFQFVGTFPVRIPVELYQFEVSVDVHMHKLKMVNISPVFRHVLNVAVQEILRVPPVAQTVQGVGDIQGKVGGLLLKGVNPHINFIADLVYSVFFIFTYPLLFVEIALGIRLTQILWIRILYDLLCLSSPCFALTALAIVEPTVEGALQACLIYHFPSYCQVGSKMSAICRNAVDLTVVSSEYSQILGFDNLMDNLPRSKLERIADKKPAVDIIRQGISDDFFGIDWTLDVLHLKEYPFPQQKQQNQNEEGYFQNVRTNFYHYCQNKSKVIMQLIYLLAYQIFSSALLYSFVLARISQFDNYFHALLALTSLDTNLYVIYNFLISSTFLVTVLFLKVAVGQVRQIQRIETVQRIQFTGFILLIYLLDNGLTNFNIEVVLLICLNFFFNITNQVIIKRSQYYSSGFNTRPLATYLFFFVLFLALEWTGWQILFFIKQFRHRVISIFLVFFGSTLINGSLGLMKFSINLYESYTFESFEWKAAWIAGLQLATNLIQISFFVYFIFFKIGLGTSINLFFFIYLVNRLIKKFTHFVAVLESNKHIQSFQQVNQAFIKERDIDQTCVICLSQIKQGRMLRCGHVFHKKCIREWIQKNENQFCPKCKAPLFAVVEQANAEAVQANSRQSRRSVQTSQQAQKIIHILKANQQQERSNNRPERVRKELGGMPFCVATEAVYYRRTEDFQMRERVLDKSAGLVELKLMNPSMVNFLFENLVQ